jgi:hypothetical protein
LAGLPRRRACTMAMPVVSWRDRHSLARIATSKTGALDSRLLATDIEHALAGVDRGWPGHVDTLCCGTLGSVEFVRHAGIALARGDLQEVASRRLMAVLETAAATGSYRWNSGKSRFNLGLFRGLAGVGYTALRQADPSLPNMLNSNRRETSSSAPKSAKIRNLKSAAPRSLACLMTRASGFTSHREFCQ